MQVTNTGDFASYSQDDVVQVVNNTTAVTANTTATTANTTALNARTNTDTAALVTMTAQAAGTVYSADQTNTAGRGVKVVFDMTVATTTSVVVTIQGKDAASGKYYDILSGAAVTTVSTNVYTVYPGLAASANVVADDVLPKTWRIKAVVTGASSAATATIGASVIV